MTKLELELPDEDQRRVEKRVAEGGFDSVNEYVLELIRRDAGHARDRLDALLLEGLDSGEPFEVTDEWWERKKRELTARAEERAK